jgi:hypothetical protein
MNKDRRPEWFIGNVVSHICDAEKPEMAIVIVGKKLNSDKIVMYKCMYQNMDYMKTLGWKKKFFWNAGNQFREVKYALSEKDDGGKE